MKRKTAEYLMRAELISTHLKDSMGQSSTQNRVSVVSVCSLCIVLYVLLMFVVLPVVYVLLYRLCVSVCVLFCLLSVWCFCVVCLRVGSYVFLALNLSFVLL